MLDQTVLTLKRLSDTRWASRKRAADAGGLLKKVCTFEFKLMLTFWNTLLKKTFALSNYL